MAGKKVKCKTCGEIIAIPEGAGDDFDFSPVDMSPPPPSPASAHRSRTGAPVPPPRPVAAGDAKLDIDENELSPDEVAAQAREVDRAYAFAGSGALEKAIPIILAVAGLGWMGVQAFRAEDPHGWVGPFRAAMYLLVYTAVVFPITLAGVRAAGIKAYFPMPGDYKWRVYGTFSLPAALGAIFTLSGGGIPMLVLGVAIGVLICLSLFIFLFNLRPHQVSKAMAYVAPYAIAGPILGVVVLVGISYLCAAALSFTKTDHEYAMSPVGPQFTWQPTAAPVQEAVVVKPKKPIEPLVLPPTTNESPVIPPVSPDATAATHTPPGVATTQPGQAEANATTQPSTTQPQVATTTPAPKEVAPAFSPLLTEAPAPLPLGQIEDAFFSDQSGTNAGSTAVLAMTMHAEFGDAFDLWDASTGQWQKLKSINNIQPKTADKCGIVLHATPAGLSMARIVEFPHTMAEIRPLTGDGAGDPSKFHTVDLDSAAGSVKGQASLLDITAGGLLITAIGGNQPMMEAFNPIAGTSTAMQRRKTVSLAGLPPDARDNVAVTADGSFATTIRYLATARGTATPGNYLVIDGLLNQGGHTETPTGLQPSRAVVVNGLSVSPDGQKVALLYQEQGAGLIEIYRIPGGKKIGAQIFGGPAAAPQRDFRGSALAWIADGSALLVNGRYVMDADTFNEMGDLGVDNVRAAHVVDHGTLLLLNKPGNGKMQVVEAKLDTTKFRATASAATTTTRPGAGRSAANVDLRGTATATH